MKEKNTCLKCDKPVGVGPVEEVCMCPEQRSDGSCKESTVQNNPMTKPKTSSVKRRKAWVVLKHGTSRVLFAETTAPRSAFYEGSGIAIFGDDADIVPCTIEFVLPTPKRKR